MDLADYTKKISELKEELAKEKAATEIRKLEQEIEFERSKYREPKYSPVSLTIPYSNHLTDEPPEFVYPPFGVCKP